MRTIEECVEAALAVLTPQVRAGFAADPITVLRDGLDLKVQQAPHLAQRRGDGGFCDGVSFLRDGVILFAPLATAAGRTSPWPTSSATGWSASRRRSSTGCGT